MGSIFFGGLSLCLLGIILLFVGFIVMVAYSLGIGLSMVIIGIIILELGSFYRRKALTHATEKIICPKCRSENKYNAKFCNNCGEELRKR